MFIDVREISTGTVIEADLCIIGAGAAGITIAREFADTDVNVCLVESGDLDFRWDTQALYRGRNVGLPYFDLDVCQIRYFGGNTNAWGGWCRPLDAIDFAPRPWLEDSGWPFPRSELDLHYQKAHDLCEIATTDYDPHSWVRRLGHKRARLLPFEATKLVPTIYQFSPPTRFGETYRKVIAGAARIRCLLNANVLAIRASADARSVSHIEAGTLGGSRFRITAKRFVLAAGGIENARLLLLSNDVATTGLGNRHDLVGRYFMEHPHTKRAVIATRRCAPLALYGLAFRPRAVSMRLALPPALQEREGLLNYSANIHPTYIGHDSQGWLAFRKLMLSLTNSRRTDPFIRFPPYGRKGLTPRQVYDIAREVHKVTAAAFLQLLQPDRLMTGYVLESKSEQAPNRLSRVTLQHERDAFGLNRAQLDWRMLPIDRRTVLRGEELIDQELRRLGIGRLVAVPPEKREDWPANLEGGWHQIGLTRMHDNPRHGVVDSDCRVHDMANLYVAGSSVFPTAGVAPPTLTIVAMALRLAAHLKRIAASEHGAPLLIRPVAAPVSGREIASLSVARSAPAERVHCNPQASAVTRKCADASASVVNRKA